MTIEHETLVTVNLDPDEAAVVLRALAHEALVQTGRGEDADHYREEARKLAAEVTRLEALVDAFKSSVDTTRQISNEVAA